MIKMRLLIFVLIIAGGIFFNLQKSPHRGVASEKTATIDSIDDEDADYYETLKVKHDADAKTKGKQNLKKRTPKAKKMENQEYETIDPSEFSYNQKGDWKKNDINDCRDIHFIRYFNRACQKYHWYSCQKLGFHATKYG